MTNSPRRSALKKATRVAAFTLLEMTIVLTIIAIIVGALVAKKSLLRAAGLRSTAAELEKYAGAISQFKVQYNALPGDMGNAITYWGTAAGTGSDSTCYNATKQGAPTCNGNGDTIISLTNPATATADAPEAFLLWQHLANAGMIEGSYSGVTSASGAVGLDAGGNTPKGRMAGMTYLAYSALLNASGDTHFPDGYYDMVLLFGGNTSAGPNPAPMLLMDQIWQLDTKMDDGFPLTGTLRVDKLGVTGPTTNASCHDNAVGANAYYFPRTNVVCGGIFGITPIR